MPKPTLAPFHDLETAVMDLLADLGTTETVTPADLGDQLPSIRVLRFGGSDDRFTDTARIDVDVFHSTRPLAFALAEAVRQRLLSFPHYLDSTVIDSVVTTASPQEIPWGDPTIRHLTASYTVAARR